MMLLSCFLSYSHLLKTFPKDTNSRKLSFHLSSTLLSSAHICTRQHDRTSNQKYFWCDSSIYIDLRTRSFTLFAYKKVFRHKFSLSFLEIWQKTKNSSFSLKLFELRRIIFLSSVCTWEGGKWGEERPFLEFLCPFLNLKCWRN